MGFADNSQRQSLCGVNHNGDDKSDVAMCEEEHLCGKCLSTKCLRRGVVGIDREGCHPLSIGSVARLERADQKIDCPKRRGIVEMKMMGTGRVAAETLKIVAKYGGRRVCWSNFGR